MEFICLALFTDVFFWPFFQLIRYHCPSILTLRRKCGIIALPSGKTTLTGGEERSGMGFTIMESFMNQLVVKSAPGKGTTVTMRKRIASRVPVKR